MLEAFTAKRRKQMQELEGLKLQNAPQRIGCFLLRQCGGLAEGDYAVSLPYCKSLLATQLGMKSETFSRALNKLKAATGVKASGGTAEIPCLEQLAEFVCCGCSNMYPCRDLSAVSH